MGKTIFAAVLAAIVASIVTTLVMGSFQTEERTVAQTAQARAEETGKVERERLDRRLGEVEKKLGSAARTARRDPVDPPPAGNGAAPTGTGVAVQDAPDGPPPPLSPDGTPYISRAELDAALVKHRTDAIPVAAEPVKSKTLEEIAQEMNLSAGEEAALREIARESETELATCLFGSRPIDEILADAAVAKDDPEKKAELTQTVVNNMIRNAGKLMTLESRTKKKVESVLGKDKAAEFQKYPMKPVLAANLEEWFKDGF